MNGERTGRVFISYRRQDSAWPARQLYEALVSRFGAHNVFKDVDDIDPGDDFVERITSAVARCDVLLALVGPMWMKVTDAHGNRRIDDPEDFVRIEIAAALARGIRVIPILIDGAPMPAPAELPPDLVPMVRRQAVSIDPVSFNTERLFATLAELFNARPDPAAPQPEPTPQPVAPAKVKPSNRRRYLLIGGGGAVASLLVALALILPPRVTSGTPPPTTTSSSASPSTSTAASAPPTTSAPPAVDVPGGPDAVMAHRGGLEEHQFQTLEAMEAAARHGYSIETDLRYTSDGIAVLVHDEEARKGLDCSGRDVRVSQTKYQDLDRLCRSTPTSVDKKAYPVPRLDLALDAIAAASPSAWLFLEVKVPVTTTQARDLLRKIDDAGLGERVVISSFSRERLAQFRALNPDLPIMLLVWKKQIPAAELKGDKLSGVAVEDAIATKAYVEQLKANGSRVALWLANDEARWAKAREFGADTVMTDYPMKYTIWARRR